MTEGSMRSVVCFQCGVSFKVGDPVYWIVSRLESAYGAMHPQMQAMPICATCAKRISKSPEPIEDVDFFRINRVRYELHVEGTVFMTADEECDDFEIDAARIDLSEPVIVGQRVLKSVERRIDEPTQPFDREAWYKQHQTGSIKPHERKRAENERTLSDYPGAAE